MAHLIQRRFVFVAAALAVLVFGVTWLIIGWHMPEQVYKDLTPKPTVRPVAKGPPAPTAPVAMAPPPRDRKAIDPEIQKLADELADHSQTPMRDLEIVGEFIGLYRKVFQSNPIGLNEDITAVLTGHNPKEGVLFPPHNPAIVKGQLVDRWGTPYWFHPSSGQQMEIRSAGPDKQLFTADDGVINPSPDHASMGFAQ